MCVHGSGLWLTEIANRSSAIYIKHTPSFVSSTGIMSCCVLMCKRIMFSFSWWVKLLCAQCVFCLSSGVSAQSFIHAFTLTSSTFNVYLTTPEVSEGGKKDEGESRGK